MRTATIPYQDPFAIYAAVKDACRTSFLLESAPGPERFVEASIIGFDPSITVSHDRGVTKVEGEEVSEPLLEVLRGLVHRGDLAEPAQKFDGGLVGMFGYGFTRLFEKVPDTHPAAVEFPDVLLGLYLDGILFDHRAGSAVYFTQGVDRLEQVKGFLARAKAPGPSTLIAKLLPASTTEEEFCRSVEKAKRYIRDGEIFQVVVAQQVEGELSGSLLEVYRRLRQRNPSPYMYYLSWERDAHAIIGSSPETLVSIRGGVVRSHPIAGTAPIGTTPDETAELGAALLEDEKELAEHNMLVDLARNDLGRVCTPGSVTVPEYLVLERFSHVQHIVSVVEGRLEPGKDAMDVLGAAFPAGTLTGAPKVRAMEIIDELEHRRRGPYGGVAGYLAFNGNMDTAILIRSLAANGKRFAMGAGAGIVADSKPEKEWEESVHKMAALRSVLTEDSTAGGL